MAAAAVTEAQSVSAQVVGNAFVQQYYNIMHHSPGLVHRFYQDISKLGRPENDGTMSITTTMQAINDKIVSLNYGDFQAEIKSVDAQESFSGGVHVLVTGYLREKENLVRSFAQTFFLAPQDRGYFVLNDMFRYLDIASVNPPLVNDVVPSTTPEPMLAAPAPVQGNHVSEQSKAPTEEAVEWEVYNPPENGDVPIVEEEIPVAEVVNEVEDDIQMVVESSAKIEEMPKKSYASIVMHLSEGVPKLPPRVNVPMKPPPKNVDQSNPSFAPATDGPISSSKSEGMPLKGSFGTHPSQQNIPFKGAPKNVEQTNPNSAPAIDGPVSSLESVDNGNNQEGEADGYSIYIKGLPMNASEALLEEVFVKFGSIKGDGVQVRSNRLQAFCFGFVEFEEASSVQKALEASPVTIGGRQAFVEEKRSTYSRGNGKGRFQSGRGSGFRNDGARGRGNYGGGRGYNRGGDFNGRGEFGNRGGNRGVASNRDGYQRYESINSNGGRINRAGVMTNGNAKNITPQVSATA